MHIKCKKCIFNVLLSSLSPGLSFSDPERQQTFVPGGRVFRPAVGDLRGSGLSEASVEPPGRVDVCLNIIGLRQMSFSQG